MFSSFQNFLPKAAAKYGFQKQFKAIEICQEYRRIAKGLLPEKSDEETFPKSYDHNTLTIGVINSSWAQQLMMQKHKIIEEINKKYGVNTVKNLKIQMAEKREDLKADLPWHEEQNETWQ